MKKLAKTNKKNSILFVIATFIISYVFCYFINKSIEIRSLYMDDLHNFYYYLRQNIWDFAFRTEIGQQHYRPLFYSSLYFIFNIINKHIWRAFFINVFVNSVISTFIYVYLQKLNINKVLSLFVSYMYILSHFAYFQIGQVIGIIDSESLFLSLSTLFFCFLYIKEKNVKKEKIYSILIYILYFLTIMAHERFISSIFVLIIVFVIKGIVSKESTFKNVIISIIEVIGIFALRFYKLRTIIPIGTGNTRVEDSFSIKSTFDFCVSQIKYIFGINDGPEHLCGINFNDVSLKIKIITYIGIVSLLLIIIIYFYYKIKSTIESNKEYKIIRIFYVDILILTYIITNIAASSVTIRLEMRWIYPTFIVSMAYLAYMMTCIFSKVNVKTIRSITIILFLIFTVSRSMVEIYYRKYDFMMYFVRDLHITNSLADETVYKYGLDNMHNKKIYIINNDFGLSGKWRYYFFEPFSGEIYTGDDPVLNFIENPNIEDAEFKGILADTDNIVLFEDYQNLKYIRINPEQ